MLIDEIVMPIVRLFSRWAHRKSESKVSPELREQIVNIIDDLVNQITLGYLFPNPVFRYDYKTAIYERVYKSLWSEFGRRHFENVNYRDEVFDFLREVPSEKFFNATERLLKTMYGRVHIQRVIPDDIIPNPSAGNELWSRKKSVRDMHIRLFKEAVDILNYRLSQNNMKHHYDELGRMVRHDSGLDTPKENNSIQEPDNNQTQEHHRNQSRSEFWNRRGYRIAVVALIFIILDFAFGDSILIRLWNSLPTIKEKIAGWFR